MIRRLTILLLIVGCGDPDKYGCLDSQACNYDSGATIDNNSCIYETDCSDVCGGLLIRQGITILHRFKSYTLRIEIHKPR